MTNEEEDKKWIEEYPVLKQVNPVNAFGVPSGYFTEMEEQVMGAIRLQQLKGDSVNNGFATPLNYFDELTQNIESRIAIDKVLSNDNAFKLPENYFDDLSQNIQSRITIEKALNTEKVFDVPENYFEELSGNILSRIAVEETVNTENIFTVPDGYFAGLESRIMAQTTVSETLQTDKEQRQGIIVKLLVSKAFKYASAACFALVVGSAIYMSEFNNPVAEHNRSFLHKEVSKMTKDELELYLQLNSDNSTILDNINVDDEGAALQDIKAEGKDN
ncbi:hypothetical protein KXQ82_13895 [Mucilaginibacter sp. HMF5004]|uniref:hypothetical protein n=1 Tax=Mucilaginibacter rivuli TaxID=2857527 RepID=UPI001C5D9D2D|nr:hypothetical protein [Mucilaginibacter rivuli]MBW4890819.1 hypothetical protein [Mucilaginibacter rivuli]